MTSISESILVHRVKLATLYDNDRLPRVIKVTSKCFNADENQEFIAQCFEFKIHNNQHALTSMK